MHTTKKYISCLSLPPEISLNRKHSNGNGSFTSKQRTLNSYMNNGMYFGTFVSPLAMAAS